MIPKIIHYIWLGKEDKPEIFHKCFDSWKKFCPDWEFKLWDESNVDLDCCLYVREAYDAKKYAFASDVIRLQKLYEYGGVYLDIDVELLRPIDSFLCEKCVAGFEINANIAPGLFLGTEKGNIDFKHIIDQYKKEHFVLGRKYNLRTIGDRFTKYYEKQGLRKQDVLQKLDSITVYPMEYFCPMNYKTGAISVTSNSYALHYYEGSWLKKRSIKDKFKLFIKRCIRALTGKKFFQKIEDRRKKKIDFTIK